MSGDLILPARSWVPARRVRHFAVRETVSGYCIEDPAVLDPHDPGDCRARAFAAALVWAAGLVFWLFGLAFFGGDRIVALLLVMGLAMVAARAVLTTRRKSAGHLIEVDLGRRRLVFRRFSRSGTRKETVLPFGTPADIVLMPVLAGQGRAGFTTLRMRCHDGATEGWVRIACGREAELRALQGRLSRDMEPIERRAAAPELRRVRAKAHPARALAPLGQHERNAA